MPYGIPDILHHIIASLSHWSALAAEGGMNVPGAGSDALAQSAMSLRTIALGINIIVGLMVIVWLGLKIRNELGKGGTQKPSANITASTIDAAIKSERKGDFLAAAANYEALGDSERAGAMYEKARDYTRSAVMYEKAGDDERAAAMYIKAGESVSAAAIYMRTRNYAEAAKIFKNKGDTLRAAQAFEMMGNSLAAAREYELAGQYMRAVKMYKNERLYKEASAMYHKAISETPLGPSTMDKYYTYAAFLVMAEELDEADRVYNEIAAVDSNFRDVTEKIRLVGIRIGKLAAAPELTLDRSAREMKEHEEISARIAARELAEKAALQKEHEPETIPEQAQPEAIPEMETAVPEVPEPEAETKEEAEHAAALEELAVPDAIEPDTAEPEPSVIPAMTAPDAEDAVPDEIVIEQGEMDDLFDEAGGSEIEDEVDEDGTLRREATLRGMLVGPMDPKYGMRVWMQILKSLYAKHTEGVNYGSMRPEAIHIDMQNNVRFDDMLNNVRFDDTGRHVPAYTAPEVLKGTAPDEQSDVYCIGVLLYEMVTGSIDGVGDKRPSEVNSDVPEWMDKMITACTEQDREMRVKSLDGISEMVLKQATQGR